MLNKSCALKYCNHSLCRSIKWIIYQLYISLFHVLPATGGLKPLVSVSGWSPHLGWQFQCNKPHEGQRNTTATCQLGWFHYKTNGQSLQLGHSSSTGQCRFSVHYGTKRERRSRIYQSKDKDKVKSSIYLLRKGSTYLRRVLLESSQA